MRLRAGRSGQRALEAVTIDSGPPLRVGRPERLFEKAIASRDVAADDRLLLVPAPDGTAPRRIDLVQHWDREPMRLALLEAPLRRLTSEGPGLVGL